MFMNENEEGKESKYPVLFTRRGVLYVLPPHIQSPTKSCLFYMKEPPFLFLVPFLQA